MKFSNPPFATADNSRLKVLSLLGLDATATKAAPHLAALVDRKSTGEDLGVSHLPAEWELKYTQPACGVKRTRLNLALKEALLTANIPLYEDWKLASLTETPGSVIATSSDGRTIEGAFLLGCDGIKSVTRSLVLAQHGRSAGEAEFTGLTQTGGTSPTPISLRARPAMLNLYGPGAHFIAYPSSPDTISWAVTQKESAETAESWKAFSEPETAALKERLLEQLEDWCDPVAALVAGAGRLIKFGLFDRPQLEPQFWVSKGARCVLLGDAAHPTSPHLGQGANQAL
jgi:salicylate hydroxylase